MIQQLNEYLDKQGREMRNKGYDLHYIIVWEEGARSMLKEAAKLFERELQEAEDNGHSTGYTAGWDAGYSVAIRREQE